MEEPPLPKINIGVDHQANIPELCNNRIDLHRAPEQLLWDPGINDALDDNEGNFQKLLTHCNNRWKFVLLLRTILLRVSLT